jgi:putative ABC transport system substrate-binding protein
MRRRDLIALVGGAVTATRGLSAQQKAMPVIGFLGSASAGSMAANVAAFREGLRQAGYIEGENLAIEYRWADGDYDRLSALAADLVGSQVEVIVTQGGIPPARAAKGATSTIPIVFIGVADPVAAGLAASLARPGGNLTGFSNMNVELLPKRFELLSELAPQVRVIDFLVNPNNPSAERMTRDVQEAARAKGVQLRILKATVESEIDAAFDTLVQLHAGALVIGPDPLFFVQRVRIAELAIRDAVPAIFDAREFPVAGGLASYGASVTDSFRKVGGYAGKILKGAKPADLPVQQPTTFELVVNLNTAKTLGITVPPSILARADEVIE